MFKIGKINPKKIKAFFKKIPIVLGEKAFLFFWVLLVLALLLGGLIFYGFYHAASQGPEKEVSGSQSAFEHNTYQRILQIWDVRGKNLRQTELKRYPDLFNL